MADGLGLNGYHECLRKMLRSAGKQELSLLSITYLYHNSVSILGFSFLSSDHKSKGWLLCLTPAKIPLSLTPNPTAVAPQRWIQLCHEVRNPSWLRVHRSHSHTGLPPCTNCPRCSRGGRAPRDRETGIRRGAREKPAGIHAYFYLLLLGYTSCEAGGLKWKQKPLFKENC